MDEVLIKVLVSGAVGLLGGGGLVKLAETLFNSRLAREKQPIDQYQTLVTTMQGRLDLIEKAHDKCMHEHARAQRELGRVDVIERDLATCKEEHAKASREIGELHGRVSELKDVVAQNSRDIKSSQVIQP